MTGAYVQREEEAQAPRRVSHDGINTTVTFGDKSIVLTPGQLEDVGNRLALDATLTKKPKTAGIAADQLRSLVERIERMNEEAAAIASDIKEIFAEAKGQGYDVKTLRKVIKLRQMDADERDEAQHLLDTYCVALGMQSSFNFEEEAAE